LRDADAEPAVIGQRAVKLVRELPVAVALEPIIVAEACANLLDCGADGLLQLCRGEVDGVCSSKN
jgi:hypothetical protein